MSGHCDFCGVWHSGSCSHPGRQWKERAERAEAERDALREANKWLDAGRTEIVPLLKKRAERAEAERDEWKGMANRQQDQNKRLFFENDALRALLAEVPPHLIALWERIGHACPQRDAARGLRSRIDAALRDGGK